jgi:uncharacterized protein (TIGR00255 family)
MPVYSMTGYASATCAGVEEGESRVDSTPRRGGAATVDLRSVNSRFLDLVLRLPDESRALEPALRELLTTGLRRGKVELRLTLERPAETSVVAPSAEQLMALARVEQQVQNWLPKAAALSVHEVLQSCRGAAAAPAADEVILRAARQCLEQLREARAREGERLVAILMERVLRLRELAAQAAPLLPQVVARQQQRFLERWKEALDSAQAASGVPAEAVNDRALSEAAAFALRIDVAEELSRLGAHLDEIARLLASGGELGKRLDFLIQELHREANTLGSKSAALELTQISVEMKVLIEQMREQVQNIE